MGCSCYGPELRTHNTISVQDMHGADTSCSMSSVCLAKFFFVVALGLSAPGGQRQLPEWFHFGQELVFLHAKSRYMLVILCCSVAEIAPSLQWLSLSTRINTVQEDNHWATSFCHSVDYYQLRLII